MEPSEIEFLSENTILGCIPNFTCDAIHLISGSIGPFRAGLPVKVPLWLGLHLKKQQRCRFVVPDWMNVDSLEELKEQETRQTNFMKMPCPHYMPVAKLIFSVAAEDIPQSFEIRTLIKDIYDIRSSKFRSFMDTFIRGEEQRIKLDNLTSMEIHTWTPLFPHALDFLSRLKKGAEQAAYNASHTSRTSRNTSSSMQHLNSTSHHS
ncbi:probable DNA replication complex GINS protein PSF2 [Lutzomyia longipalpis]|uniref:probable DNA replication complex GINS protein PSF2 n=1 Tax=Lutzomyia longipalpis TaxID=7200 RepID=UPI00248375FC|nr:probable DNA replication complex GINS protein PSF2 [Lutzomyia longipalpis]